MSQIAPLGDPLPAISVTGHEPDNSAPSPVILAALDDSRLSPMPPISKISPDYHQTTIESQIPRILPPSDENRTFPAYKNKSRLFAHAKNVVETQSKIPRRGLLYTGCHVHSSNDNDWQEKKPKDGRKRTAAPGGWKASKEVIPSFSSPWGPSSCSAKRVSWKEVEAHNRQRKRMRFLGWSNENFRGRGSGTSCSSTACSDTSESFDTNENFGASTCPGDSSEGDDDRHRTGRDGKSESQSSLTQDSSGGSDIKTERCKIEGISIVITTLKDGKTTTVLEAGPNAKVENGVEIVTKTVVCGDEVTTTTTTSFIPLALAEMNK